MHRNSVHTLRFLAAACLLGLVPGHALAEERMDWSSSVQPQLELTTHLSERLNVRFGVNRFESRLEQDFDREDHLSGLDDDITASALIDWEFGSSSGMRMTGGALYGDLGWGHGSLDSFTRAEADYGRDELRTYVGLGWDRDFGQESRFGLQLDLGVAFEGVPMDSGDGSELRRMEQDAELGQRFESFRYVPMFSAGMEYRF